MIMTKGLSGVYPYDLIPNPLIFIVIPIFDHSAIEVGEGSLPCAQELELCRR